MATRPPAAWYDAQYDARAGIPEQAAIRQGWQDRSAHTRATRPISQAGSAAPQATSPASGTEKGESTAASTPSTVVGATRGAASRLASTAPIREASTI